MEFSVALPSEEIFTSGSAWLPASLLSTGMILPSLVLLDGFKPILVLTLIRILDGLPSAGPPSYEMSHCLYLKVYPLLFLEYLLSIY